MPPKGTVYRVEQAMNDQHAMVLEAVDGGATVHAVEYATARIRDRLAALSPGDTARLGVTRVGHRADVWRVDRTYPGVASGRRTHAEAARRTARDDTDRAGAKIRVSPPDAV